MVIGVISQPPHHVALLAEGVDRNNLDDNVKNEVEVSPSSRRAWIEISMLTVTAGDSSGRPPRGGRG